MSTPQLIFYLRNKKTTIWLAISCILSVVMDNMPFSENIPRNFKMLTEEVDDRYRYLQSFNFPQPS